MDRNNLLQQGQKFLLISAIGWTIDFSIYSYLTYLLNINVAIANGLSAIPAVTFVFFMSTKKTFYRRDSRVTLTQKYFIYFVYQMILLVCVSILNQYIYNFIWDISLDKLLLINNYAKTISKLIITPITMVINFFVMKVLIEKI